jgi:hypothetical protein
VCRQDPQAEWESVHDCGCGSGKLPSGHAELRTSDIYVPIGQWNDVIFHQRNVGMGMNAIGRMKPGMTIQQVRADMARVTTNLAGVYPDDDSSVGARLFY